MERDPYGRAIRDHYLGTREEPLLDRDGPETREHAIERWYFGEHDPDAWRDRWLREPVLDLGAGVGRDALYYQRRFDTVAIDVSEHLVETMRDRGVDDARVGDMFSLPAQFERDRFRSAQAIGTQVGLAGSMAGVRAFLGDLAVVTAADATAVIDNYDPDLAAEHDVFAYREDPAPGLAYRVFHCEYEGDVGRTLLFRLFDVKRLRNAAVGTPWEVAAVEYGETQWRAALKKG
ncbi:SAM-dependent methyltransferase [Halalkaliarchaeum desulfuricum]|uniref:SAM-dependent methyltransferase n=1 Tax=Halalkaliarchaeum desulfuricum TaxID=2055893 RepID=A0A343TIZ5_9EURY|nr:class I SAM-dependent methyltransferase [Halalkaliarchaeum desulfuricum]AUX09067.1 SAM-dependent methyltransferase [Halalkaliarchaeum desulfuricum]